MPINFSKTMNSQMHTITLVMPDMQKVSWDQIIADIDNFDPNVFPFPDDYDENFAGMIKEDFTEPYYKVRTDPADIILHEKAATGSEEAVRDLLKHDIELLREWSSGETQEKDDFYGCFGSIVNLNGGCYLRGSANSYFEGNNFSCSLNSVYLVLKRLVVFMVAADVDYDFMTVTHNKTECPF